LAKEPAWYDYLLRLLTVPSRDQIPSDLESDEAVFAKDLVNTVLDILFRVMWRGVQGYEEDAWKVTKLFHFRGQKPITRTDQTILGFHSFLRE
jgi:hypothetical protein